MAFPCGGPATRRVNKRLKGSEDIDNGGEKKRFSNNASVCSTSLCRAHTSAHEFIQDLASAVISSTIIGVMFADFKEETAKSSGNVAIVSEL